MNHVLNNHQNKMIRLGRAGRVFSAVMNVLILNFFTIILLAGDKQVGLRVQAGLFNFYITRCMPLSVVSAYRRVVAIQTTRTIEIST